MTLTSSFIIISLGELGGGIGWRGVIEREREREREEGCEENGEEMRKRDVVERARERRKNGK